MAGPANTPHARPGGLATGLGLIRMRQTACLPRLCPLLAKADLRQREERGHEGPYHRKVEPYLEQPGAAEHDRAQSVHAVRERQAGADRLEPTGRRREVEEPREQDLRDDEQQHEHTFPGKVCHRRAFGVRIHSGLTEQKFIQRVAIHTNKSFAVISDWMTPQYVLHFTPWGLTIVRWRAFRVPVSPAKLATLCCKDAA